MSDNRIILYDGKREIAEAEAKLVARRAKIVEGLESCRVAMDKFLERSTEYDDLEPLFQATGEEARKEVAVKLWLSKTRQTVPALTVKLISVIIIPPEVKELLRVFQAYKENESQDPKKYWDEKAKVFAALPVSKEDRDIISERCRVYCASKVDPELGKFAFQLVKMVNYGNSFFSRYGGGTSPIEDNPDTFMHFLKPLLVGKHIPVNDNGGIIWEFALKPGLFTQDGEFKIAFDESIESRKGAGFKSLSLTRGIERDPRYETMFFGV